MVRGAMAPGQAGQTPLALTLVAGWTASCRAQQLSWRKSELRIRGLVHQATIPHLFLVPSRILMYFQFLFLAHTKKKEKKLIIIYKRSSFQTNGKAFNADIYFSPHLNGIYLNADFLVSYVELGRNAFQFKC